MITLPDVLKPQVLELNQLIERYPVDIPLLKVAKFMHIDPDGLRRCIETGKCPFGISWQKN